MYNIFLDLVLLISLLNGNIVHIDASNCGCKTIRKCYGRMLETLHQVDEAPCISDAAIGATTVTIFLKAIQKFCPTIIEIYDDKLTYEGRHLYEVHVRTPKDVNAKEDDRAMIVVDAGQEAGTESVGLALFLIEQLLACHENNDMITKVRWVIMPSANPDGQEFARYSQLKWRKNLRLAEDNLSYGVDISRNFEGDWKSCPAVGTGFSPIYPGIAAGSENETIFIQDILQKYRKYIKVYISIRRDGHSLSYPYGYDSNFPPGRNQLEKVAAAFTAKVNQRAGGVHLFTNQSIFEENGKARCGHSVDYAYQHMTIPYSFEMRVFLESENTIMTKFQALPRGYESSLRSGYYSGLRELFSVVTKEKQYRH